MLMRFKNSSKGMGLGCVCSKPFLRLRRSQIPPHRDGALRLKRHIVNLAFTVDRNDKRCFCHVLVRLLLVVVHYSALQLKRH